MMNGTAMGSTGDTPTFFGIAVSTHRGDVVSVEGDNNDNDTSSSMAYFPYECWIAAIAICFFRYTVKIQTQEPAVLRYFFCALLAALAFTKKSYELVAAVEIFSYTVSWLLLMPLQQQERKKNQVLIRLFSIAAGAVLSMVVAHGIFTSGVILKLMALLTPRFVVQTLEYLFPIAEIKAAYSIMHHLALEPDAFEQMIQHLFFVTCHIQVGMGYLGIDFLRKEQSRRNQLIRLDVAQKEDSDDDDDDDEQKENDTTTSNNSKNGSNGTTTTAKHDDKKKSKNKDAVVLERSRRFQRSAAPFIFGVALPYMAQIITFGNLNKFAFSCVQDEMHRMIRFRQVFEHDNHLTAMTNDSPVSPEAYAASMNTVVSTAYDMFNRKLFSLPKVLLLPGVIARQPMLVVQVFPFIFISDWLKASVVSYMTTQIESLQKEIMDLSAIRSKVESFDIKNAELLQRSGKGATQFTQRRWEELTVKVQSRMIVSDLLTRSKGFFAFMQRNFVFTVLIDCALANLIAIGRIFTSEIFVFSRAIEDAVDMMLMRSRGEAELARMMTEIEKLEKLSNLWESSKEPNLLRCHIADTGAPVSPVEMKKRRNLVLRNLHYSRGTASARADHIELSPGVYALTGANGSGKSTLFRILMSCHTNEKSIDLPSSINLLTPAEPLTEEDDLLRENACLADEDDEDGEEDCEADTGGKEPSHPADMPHHIPKLSITMPSSQIFEISQNFYWPLYSKPIDWIYQEHVSESCNSTELEKRVRIVAEELHSLEFFQAAQLISDPNDGGDDDNDTIIENESLAQESKQVSGAASAETTINRIMSELQEEKEDWFGDLSGGQKSKVELVRTVFLRERCPDVLLIDETMAPLDPASKEAVMAKVKLFCENSIIIVIYHTDVGQGKEVEGKMVDCVPSNDFFDKNIHLQNGIVHVRETC